MTLKELVEVFCGNEIWIYLSDDFLGSPMVTLRPFVQNFNFEKVLNPKLLNRKVYLFEAECPNVIKISLYGDEN